MKNTVLIRNFFFLFSFLLIVSTSNKEYIFNDTVSYLEISNLILKGQFYDSFNSYWSPLYPIVVSFFSLLLFQIEDPYLIIQTASIFIYLIQTYCFYFFLKTFLKYNIIDEKNYLDKNTILIFGLLLYLICCHFFIPSSFKTPDTLVGCFLFLSFAKIISLTKEENNNIPYILLGLFLGLGYLSKTYFFVVSIFIIILMFSYDFIYKRSFSKTFLTTIIFLLISLPFVLIISIKNNGLTIGNAGKYNLYENINYNTEPFPFSNQWEKHSSISSKSKIQLINKKPNIYKINYDTKTNPTFPIWYDPSYFYNIDKIKMNINYSKVFPKFIENSKHTLHYFKRTLKQFFFAEIIEINFKQFLFPYFIVVLFFFCKIHKSEWFYKNITIIFLLATTLFSIFIFNLSRVESRYLYPFIIILSFISIIYFPYNRFIDKKKIIMRLITFSIVTINIYAFLFIILSNFNSDKYKFDYLGISNGIKNLNLDKNSSVAVVGNGGDFPKIAILLNLKITHFISPEKISNFDINNDKMINNTINILNKESVDAIFYHSENPIINNKFFKKIRDTGYYYLIINN